MVLLKLGGGSRLIALFIVGEGCDCVHVFWERKSKSVLVWAGRMYYLCYVGQHEHFYLRAGIVYNLKKRGGGG